jgi:hypothetical protein
MDKANKTKKSPTLRDICSLIFTAVVFTLIPIWLFFYQISNPPITYLWVLVVVIATVVYAVRTLMDKNPVKFQFLSMLVLFGVVFANLQSLFCRIYTTTGLRHPDGTITNDKYDALYFSLITWTTTGYGDLLPCGTGRWWACIEALLGTAYTPFALVTLIWMLNNWP